LDGGNQETSLGVNCLELNVIELCQATTMNYKGIMTVCKSNHCY
jgi:hypothetical protein